MWSGRALLVLALLLGGVAPPASLLPSVGVKGASAQIAQTGSAFAVKCVSRARSRAARAGMRLAAASRAARGASGVSGCGSSWHRGAARLRCKLSPRACGAEASRTRL
jgi:hypothetical protein